MATVNHALVIRMIEHGYSDQEIVLRLRYNQEHVKLIRERVETVREKLNLSNDIKTVSR